MYYLYFIQILKNFKTYVGYSHKNPEIRLREHNLGSNQWSNNNRPFKLVFFKKITCLTDVKLREKFYKTGFGKNIKKLIVDYINNKKIKVVVK